MDIRYNKGDGSDITERVIIPTNIPNDYISALDVSDLDVDEISKLKLHYSQYLEYVELFKQNMFSFDGWLEHTGVNNPNLKYRRFTISKTDIV